MSTFRFAVVFGFILLIPLQDRLNAAITTAEVPQCTSDTVAAYISLTGGCSVGEFTLKNFAWNSITGESFVPVPATSVLVTPERTTGSVNISFVSDAFNIRGNQQIKALLDYLIDPAPPILDEISLELSADSPVPPGFAIITSDICIGGLLRNNCFGGVVNSLTVQDFGANSPANVLTSSVVFPAPVNLVDVRTTIQLVANGQSSQIRGFGTVTTTIPEPSTATTVLGAVALAIAARVKARARKRT